MAPSLSSFRKRSPILPPRLNEVDAKEAQAGGNAAVTLPKAIKGNNMPIFEKMTANPLAAVDEALDVKQDTPAASVAAGSINTKGKEFKPENDAAFKMDPSLGQAVAPDVPKNSEPVNNPKLADPFAAGWSASAASDLAASSTASPSASSSTSGSSSSSNATAVSSSNSSSMYPTPTTGGGANNTTLNSTLTDAKAISLNETAVKADTTTTKPKKGGKKGGKGARKGGSKKSKSSSSVGGAKPTGDASSPSLIGGGDQDFEDMDDDEDGFFNPLREDYEAAHAQLGLDSDMDTPVKENITPEEEAAMKEFFGAVEVEQAKLAEKLLNVSLGVNTTSTTNNKNNTTVIGSGTNSTSTNSTSSSASSSYEAAPTVLELPDDFDPNHPVVKEALVKVIEGHINEDLKDYNKTGELPPELEELLLDVVGNSSLSSNATAPFSTMALTNSSASSKPHAAADGDEHIDTSALDYILSIASNTVSDDHAAAPSPTPGTDSNADPAAPAAPSTTSTSSTTGKPYLGSGIAKSSAQLYEKIKTYTSNALQKVPSVTIEGHVFSPAAVAMGTLAVALVFLIVLWIVVYQICKARARARALAERRRWFEKDGSTGVGVEEGEEDEDDDDEDDGESGGKKRDNVGGGVAPRGVAVLGVGATSGMVAVNGKRSMDQQVYDEIQGGEELFAYKSM